MMMSAKISSRIVSRI